MNLFQVSSHADSPLRLVFKSFGPVVFERNLNAIVVHVESISEVHSPAKLKFAAHGYSFGWVVEQVPKRVAPLMKRGRQLRVGICNVHQRIACGGSETLAPGVIQEGNNAQYRQGYPNDRLLEVGEIVFYADVDGRIIHIVLYTLAINDLKLGNIVLGEIKI